MNKKTPKPLRTLANTENPIHPAIKPIARKLSDTNKQKQETCESIRNIAPPLPQCFSRKQPYPSNLVAWECDDFIKLRFPKNPPILGKWLRPQSLVMIYAARGCGKTFLALSIAHVIATGGVLFGWKARTPRKVLYLDGEMAAVPLQRRLRTIVRSAKTNPKEMLQIVTVGAD